MNYAMILYILGWILNFTAIFMIVPCVTALCFHETAWFSFLVAILISLTAGLFVVRKKPKNTTLYAKEGFIIVAFSWIVISLFWALPYLISGAIPNAVDAWFESVSGLTTTGASILNDIEAVPKSILLWRSFSNWIGGMGVLVFIMAILPLSGGSNMYMMKAESPGPSVGKLVPHVKTTAKILYSIYIAMTIFMFLCLKIAGMKSFDAVNAALATAGTGGFGIKNDSFQSYPVVCQVITTIFMIAFGVNFNVYYLLLKKRFKEIWKISEWWIYLLVILGAVLIILYDTKGMFSGIGDALNKVFFQVATIISTTGFSTDDFNLWPEMSRTVLVFLMFIGACAGSTGGGIKISRFTIWIKTIFKELDVIVHVRNVKKVKMDGKVVEHEVIRSVNVYFAAYMLIFAISVFLLTFDELDLVTNFTSVAATINNIGPGLELTGPAGNFSVFSWYSKLVLIFDMLAGRLELFPLLILFAPGTWKK
jgi:trk system potassium uptake protein TrkH